MTNVCKNWSSENNLSNPITWDVCLEWAPLQISITWNHDENDFFFCWLCDDGAFQECDAQRETKGWHRQQNEQLFHWPVLWTG